MTASENNSKVDPKAPAADKDALIEERRQYATGTLERAQLAASPFKQFEFWLGEARKAGLIDATSVALTSVDADARPHTRVVLLKQFDDQGFVWFTDQTSDKAQQIAANSAVCMLFFWRELERQVRIEGQAHKVPADVSDEYFYSRPQESRFSAAASKQSSVVANRAVLEAQVQALRDAHPEGDVARPEHWGGYQLVPDYFEFWQGRNDRLHDRFVYRQKTSGETNQENWQIDRLSP